MAMPSLTPTNDPIAVQGLTISADGSWSFDPADPAYNALAEGEVQTITVNYQVEDAAGLTDANTFLITLTGTNDAPVATFSTAQTATEDAEPITGQLTSTDADAKDTVSYSLLGADIPGLTINANGAWSFDPADAAYQGLAAGDTQDITVNYSATDNNASRQRANSFVITLTGTNDIPVVDTNAISNLQAALRTPTTRSPRQQLLAGISDADRDATTGKQQTLDIADLIATDAAGNSAGSFTLNQSGTSWTFTPTEHFNGTVNLSYNVTDGTASTAASNTFELASVNDAPALTGDKAVLKNGDSDTDAFLEDNDYIIKASELLSGYSDADQDQLSVLALNSESGTVEQGVTDAPSSSRQTWIPMAKSS